GITAWFVVRYRRTDHAAAPAGPEHNTLLEVTWTIIPLLIAIAMFYLGMKSYIELRVAPPDAYVVYVTAQKWSWTFDHPNGGQEIGELHVPANRPVKFVMASQDVLHAMFVPDFRVKQDIVPGRYTTLWFEAPEPGPHRIYCAEYCGKDHSQMTANLIVVAEEEWDQKIFDIANWIKDVPEEEMHLAGNRLYPLCQSCHSLDEKPGTGPSFRETHDLLVSGGTRTFTDGTTAVVNEDYILNSILVPQGQIVETYTGAMPSFKGSLTEKKRRALLEFIRQLNKYDNAGNLIT
ncbi:MAG: cytochrome c oxidase subunit II, partial [Phycisphaerales bacterium]|nr:cytochrome c oxidase subunit II [Phycisphaerales bacterium]